MNTTIKQNDETTCIIKLSLDTFFKENYSELLIISNNICKSDESYDILNEAVLDIYSMPKAKVADLIYSKTLLYYIIRIIQLSKISKTSKYQNKYKKHLLYELPMALPNKIDEAPTYTEENYLSLEKALTALPWHLKKIVDFRIHTDKTYVEFSKETFISPTMLFKLWRKSLDILKKELV